MKENTKINDSRSLFSLFAIVFRSDRMEHEGMRKTTKSDKNYCRGYYKTNGNLY
jgi:hypothetical protein